MKHINAKGTNVAVCEPTVTNDRYLGSRIGYNLKALKEQRDVIIANWHHVVLSDLQQKVYPRHYLGRRPEPTRLGNDTMHERRQKR